MSTNTILKLLELIRVLIRAPYRSSEDAQKLEAKLDEIKQEVENG
jgi:hypothetical protein